MIVEGAGLLHILIAKGAEILYNIMQGAETLYDDRVGSKIS
jgi:hypothetical protein